MRVVLVTPNALTLPAFTCGTALITGANMSLTWPPITSVSAGMLPL